MNRAQRIVTGCTLAVAGIVAAAVVVIASRTAAPVECPSRLPALVAAKVDGRCGVLLGAAVEPVGGREVDRLGRKLGRALDMVYEFHDLDDRVPTAGERALAASGRILHITIDSRLYESPSTVVTWAQVAAGRYDADLLAQARGIASLHAPVLVTFDHEPDQPRRDDLGSPADFVAAWRHVHSLYERAGAHDAIWTWVVTGATETAPRALAMWPGNGYVDWISWEAYNPSGCRNGGVTADRYLSFAQAAAPFFDVLQSEGPAAGIDVDKPMMISEAGSVLYPHDLQRTAGWYRGMNAFLEAHPRIRAVGLWDRPGNPGCSYRFDGSAAITRAIGASIRARPFDLG